VRRWRDDLGLSEDRIIEAATETRRDHPAPPDGPKALDRAMERAAKRDAQVATASPEAPTGKRQPKRTEGARPSAEELAAFYADMVNSDRYLPANAISNTIQDAMQRDASERLQDLKTPAARLDGAIGSLNEGIVKRLDQVLLAEMAIF